MSRGPDASTLLERALLASAAAAGCPIGIARSEMERWASVTFAGARHRIVLTGAASPALNRWTARLPEAELALRGHLVADLTIERRTRQAERVTIELEILTVEAK